MAKTESTLTALIGINKAQILRVQIKIQMYLNYNRLNVDLSTSEGHFDVEMLKRHARNTAEICVMNRLVIQEAAVLELGEERWLKHSDTRHNCYVVCAQITFTTPFVYRRYSLKEWFKTHCRMQGESVTS